METPIVKVKGNRKDGNLNNIEIYSDRLVVERFLLPKKIIYLNDITSWIEINKIQKQTNRKWSELTIYTGKTKYTISSISGMIISKLKVN